METIRSYEDMENYVRNQIENSWDFMYVDGSGIYMTASIDGTFEEYYSSVFWNAGERAEEETVRKAFLEAESLFEITEEDARNMRFSDELEERDLAERFYRRIDENKADFWEPEYMAAMDDPETEVNIKILAEDLWKQWKEYELDE